MTSDAIQPDEIPLADAAALALWPLVLAVGLVGFVIPYARPVPPAKKDLPIVAEALDVQLTSDPLPAPALAPSSAAQPPPHDATPLPRVDTPQLTPVAEPSTVAFALPVEGPTRVVEARQAAFAASAIRAEPVPAVAPVATPRQLVYGEGEGRQPAPEYPYRARREGQEGVVKIRFSVGETGQVLSAEPAAACPWPLLNDAAVRVVRERWRFRPGTLRLYEVSIRFQLTR